MAGTKTSKREQRVKDFDTTGNGFMFTDPLKGNYASLMAAIYQRAFIDVYESRHATTKNKQFEKIRYNGQTAMQFLIKNPYGLNYDIEMILAKMEKEDFVQKERYNNNELWDI